MNCFRLGTLDAPNFGPETATSILKYAIGVRQFFSVIFAPFGRTDQAFLFRVPTSDHNRSLRLPS